MNSLRLSKDAFRSFAPVISRRSIQASTIARRLPHSSLRYNPTFAPPKPRFTPTKRYFSHSGPVRQELEAQKKPESEDRWANTPAYEMTFTCKQCSTRSSHKISKQGYHNGTVLVTCPGCKNRHLIADHLKIFSDQKVTLEDIMKEKGQLVKRGTLSAEGDVEFWDDGTETMHTPKNDETTTPS